MFNVIKAKLKLMVKSIWFARVLAVVLFILFVPLALFAACSGNKPAVVERVVTSTSSQPVSKSVIITNIVREVFVTKTNTVTETNFVVQVRQEPAPPFSPAIVDRGVIVTDGPDGVRIQQRVLVAPGANVGHVLQEVIIGGDSTLTVTNSPRGEIATTNTVARKSGIRKKADPGMLVGKLVEKTNTQTQTFVYDQKPQQPTTSPAPGGAVYPGGNFPPPRPAERSVTVSPMPQVPLVSALDYSEYYRYYPNQPNTFGPGGPLYVSPLPGYGYYPRYSYRSYSYRNCYYPRRIMPYSYGGGVTVGIRARVRIR